MVALTRARIPPASPRTSRGGLRLGRQRGAELIEFALVLPVLLLILVGIIDFAFFFQRYEVVTNAAREGARVGVLSGYLTTDAEARALSYLDAVGLTDARRRAVATQGTITLPNSSQVSTIEVRVTYPHDFLFLAPVAAFFGGTFGTMNVVGDATMRTEAQAGS